MKRIAVFSLALFFAALSAQGFAAPHTKDTDCLKCHLAGEKGSGPKVVPEEPGFFAKLFQKKQSFRGHPNVSCTGVIKEETVEKGVKKLVATGCHAIDKGYRKLLVAELKNKPVDDLCALCHPNQRGFGTHHPSYQTDKNGDGVGDRFVVPAQGQEILNTFVPEVLQEPLKSYPDSFVMKPKTDKEPPALMVAMPLATFQEQISPTEIRNVPNVVTCTTCHNPHFGYLSAVQTPEELNNSLVGRQQGDVQLRMRDFDNTLCLACH